MIKLIHTHENGTECFISDDQGLSKKGIYRMHGQEFIMGYKNYTGHWYAYDKITGQEIATISKEFYENCFAQHKKSDLLPDPNCK